MAQGQNTTIATLAFMQALITFFGTRKTGMTGAQKRDAVVNTVAPLLPVAASIAAGNTNDAAHKAEITVLAQGMHDALQASGVIHDTAALESGAVPAVASPLTPAPQIATSNA